VDAMGQGINLEEVVDEEWMESQFDGCFYGNLSQNVETLANLTSP
jgi:hypothetical protein